MSMLLTNLLLWGSIIWLPWLMYAMQKNEARPKKNIIVGVTLPYEARGDSEVLAVLATYKKELKKITWLSLLPAIPSLFIKSFGLSMTVWLTWVVVICFIPCIPYVRCNRALRRLKEARGWRRGQSRGPVADLNAVAMEFKWLSPLLFLPPFLVSLIPLFMEPEMWILWLILSLTVALFYVCYRYLYRNRAEMVDGDTERTVVLTRIRRYHWGKTWLIMAWATGILNPLIWLTMDHIWWSMAVFLVYTIAVVWVAIGIEFRVRGLQEKLSAGSGRDFYVDEDDNWIWGMFYYNPNDSHLLVNARVGMNSTVNLAKRSGQVIAALLLVVLLICPLTGLWLMNMERTPVVVTVEDGYVLSSHVGRKYAVAVEEIKSAELLETLPPIRRLSGTGMPDIKTGIWSSEPWGRFYCCINSEEGPWLLIETEEGELYLLGGGEENAAEQVFTQIKE